MDYWCWSDCNGGGRVPVGHYVVSGDDAGHIERVVKPSGAVEPRVNDGYRHDTWCVRL